MMIKAKHIYAYGKQVDPKTRIVIPIDEAINEFLEANDIQEDRLIDIKFSSLGFFQEKGDGEIEPSALIIYRV